MSDPLQQGSWPTENPKFFTLEEFTGLNTKATRSGIEEQQFSWCENWFPIGAHNLRTLYGKGANLFTTANPRSVISFYPYNIGTTAYICVFQDNGTAIQVRISDGATTTISAVANTFYNGAHLPKVFQVSNAYLIILSTTSANGYYIWDGTLLYGPQTLAAAGIVVTSGGAGYAVAPGVTFAGGGGGVGAAATAQIAGGAVVSVTITNPGSGYTVAPTVGFTAGAATATAHLMPLGIAGTAGDVFQSRLWIVNGTNLITSVPGLPNMLWDFATVDGGGVSPSTDSFLKVAFSDAVQSNGFLYVFGDQSVNVVSNPINSGSPSTLTFNNDNVDPQMGTPWTNSLQAFGHILCFANTSGIYAVYGGVVDKISDELDGIFLTATLPVTGPETAFPSSAVTTLFNIKVYMLLINILDPFTLSNRKALMIWDGKKWFVGSQEVGLTFINSLEFNGTLTAYGTDGTSIFPLFTTPSATLAKLVQGKLWSGDSSVIIKRVMRVYQDVIDNAGSGAAITISVDTDVAGQSVSIAPGSTLTFINNSGGVIQFQNNLAQNIFFTTPGLAIAGSDLPNFGKRIGFTIATESQDVTLVEAKILYDDYSPFA